MGQGGSKQGWNIIFNYDFVKSPLLKLQSVTVELLNFYLTFVKKSTVKPTLLNFKSGKSDRDSTHLSVVGTLPQAPLSTQVLLSPFKGPEEHSSCVKLTVLLAILAEKNIIH